LRGIQASLAEIESKDVVVVGVSVDSPEQSRDLREKAGLAFQILSDPNLEAIHKYDLVHAKGGPDGHDISRPGEFLVDSYGVVRWVNLTEDFRIRARAEQFLAAAQQLK
jgi:glutaredoxin-dependent peroxiredoxin